jgi:hypothetical protein
MRKRWLSAVTTGRSGAVCLATLLAMGGAAAQNDGFSSDEGVEILTRGPVHEAFANLSESEAGYLISRQPPEEIEELPPDYRPEGGNVAWIPGYWSWDDDRNDFIWVSGVWRELPPDRQWVPGYWTSSREGWQFVSGFWANNSRNEIEYLPRPPDPIERGPSSPRIGADDYWSPGCWVWVNTRYAWQSGYWVPQHTGWVWTPAHYVWTPRGYVYVSGYWDHDIIHRGVMFAPVYYSSPIYRRADYYYSPQIVIDIFFALDNFFVQARSHHYYYGDYYDARYGDRGYEPWYSRRHAYDRDEGRDRYYREDPIFISYRSQQIRRDPEWDKRAHDEYAYRRNHEDARPPQTYRQQVVSRPDSDDRGSRQRTIAARPLDQVVNIETERQKYERVDADRRTEIQSRTRDVRRFRVERQQVEVIRESGVDAANVPERVHEPKSRTRNDNPQGPAAGQARTDSNRNQTPPTAIPDAAHDGARNRELTQPVREPLRESPIAAKRGISTIQAPPAPEVPKSEAKSAEPAGKESSAHDKREERSRGRDTQPGRDERPPRNGSKRPK